MRATIWPLLFGVDEMVKTRNLDYRILSSKELKKEDDIQIRKDLDRTFPENLLFKSDDG